LSCSANICLHGGQCSTRLNGIFYCQCPPPYFGIQCESGSCSFSFFFPLYFSLLLNKKNRRIREKWTNNINEFLYIIEIQWKFKLGYFNWFMWSNWCCLWFFNSKNSHPIVFSIFFFFFFFFFYFFWAFCRRQ